MKVHKYYLYTIILWLAFLMPARADIGLRIATETGMVGDIVSVPVYVDTSLTSLNILSYQVSIDYNANLLEALEPSYEGTVSAGWGNPVSNIANIGRVTISHAGVLPLTGTGVLAYLQFRLKAQGTVYLNFVTGNQTIFNEGGIPVYLTNGRVTISPQPYLSFSPNGGLIAIGETLQYYVSRGTAPYTWSTTDLSVASISSNGLVTGISPGKVKVIATDNTGIKDTADYWVEVVPFTLRIRDSSYYQNNYVTIPVNISRLDDFNVMGGEVRVGFNESILKAEEVIYAGSLLEIIGNKIANLSLNGAVTVSFASSMKVRGSGPLFFIRFKVDDRSSGGTWIDIQHAVFNEELKAKVYRGYFNIMGLPNLTVRPINGQLLVGETLDFNASGGIEPYQWSVSNPGIASIDEDGLLLAEKGGQVVVMVTDPRGSNGQSGIINIYDGTIQLGDVIIPADGTSVQLPVYLSSDISMLPVISLSGGITFNANNIESIDINNAGTSTQSWSYSANQVENHFQFAGAGVSGVSGDITMMGLEVFIKQGLNVGLVIPLNFSDIIVNEGYPRLLVEAGSVEIGEPTAIDDNLKDEIRVIYSPTFVKLENIPEDSRWLSLYSITGEQVFKTKIEGKTSSLLRSQFVKGIYLIEITGNNKLYLKIKL